MTDSAFPAAPFAAPTRIDVNATPLAVVRHEGVRIDALVPLFDAGYAAIGSLFADGALVPTGPAIAVYYGDPMDTFDLELGFPVANAPVQPISVGEAEVRASALPAGPAYASTHIGPYDDLGAAWQSLAHAVDVEPVGVWIESYVGNPVDTAPGRLRTDLIMPVQD